MPDLKTALQNAIQAKAPKTVKEQSWLWIKDHPEKTFNEISFALKGAKSDVIRQCIYKMRKEGYIKDAKSTRFGKSVNVYRVSDGKVPEFAPYNAKRMAALELARGTPRKASPKKKAEEPSIVFVTQTASSAAPSQGLQDLKALDLMSYNVRDLLELRARINAIFKE